MTSIVAIGHGAGHRVTGVGEAVVELAALVHQGLGDAVADQHAAERQVAAVDALGEGHEIGLDAVVLRAEPLAEPAEAGDHLVGDQQDAVLVADALDLRPVGVRRDDHAAGALHRLADEGRDVVDAELRGSCARARRPSSGRTRPGACPAPSSNQYGCSMCTMPGIGRSPCACCAGMPPRLMPPMVLP